LNQLETLTNINLDDLVAAFGWQSSSLPAMFLRQIFHSPAKRFARQMVEFDAAVGLSGLVEGARAAQRYYARQLSVHQSERIPAGSFLALSNHPGMTDTLSLFCALARPDSRIIALQRPFLEALPNVARHLFYVDDDPAKRLGLVRRVARICVPVELP
jgi:hypothetical protein